MSSSAPAQPASGNGAKRRRRGNLSAVGLSSIVAAGAGYLVLFISARSLTPEENAQFLTFWALLFFILGVVSGIINEFTRAVRGTETGGRTAGRGAAVFPLGVSIGAAVSIAVVASSPLWATTMFPVDTVPLVAVLALTAFAYAGHCSLAGAAGGLQRWSLFAGLAASEAVARLCLVLAVVVAAGSRFGLEAATAAAAATWLLALLIRPSARLAIRARADVDAPGLLANAGHAMVSAAATAALITGFPILLRLTSPLEEFAAAAPLILAIALTRAPIMVPLQAFQAVLISRFVGVNGPALLKAVCRPVVALLALGLVGALAAALAGPRIMLVFGPAYVLSPLTMALLTFAGCLMAVLTVTGTACLARGSHFVYSAGWLIATIATFGLLLLPGDLETRATVSLLVGPLVGVLFHAVALLAKRIDPEPTPTTGTEQ